MKPVTLLVALLAVMALGFAQPSASAVARTQAVQKAKLALEEECRREAAGNWEAWYGQLEPFRAAMLALTERTPQRTKGKRLLELLPDPPLYEDSQQAWYMILPDGLQVARPESRVLKAITTASSWLKRRRVDLIFVPVPKVSEVYPDRLVKQVPPSRIVAPHIRKLIYELLKADVEVLDLLPAFLAARGKSPRPLYYAADPHWTNEAEKIAAQAIAERLKRYPFVQKALKAAPLYRVEPVAFRFNGVQYPELTPEEQRRVGPLLDVPMLKVLDSAGKPFEETDDARAIIIGDSYTHCSRYVLKGTGINALLAKEINQPITNISSGGATLQPFKEIVRDRDEILVAPLVIVWIISNCALTDYPDWQMPQLPEN
ncbi:MAG: hypothetical protein EHM61_23775 [Acidobacteria bacterium]|nr:MAG: hypothetical protein EHM61_23775 [Acidobacteriota bacterium]